MNPYGLGAGDFFGDSKVDLVALEQDSTSPPTYKAVLFRGNGDGTFLTQTSITLGTGLPQIQEFVAADLRRDGRLDLVAIGGNSAYVFLNNGDGSTFQPPVGYATGLGASDVKVADVNGDGVPDIVVANGSSGLDVLFGNGDGTFGPPQSFATGTFDDTSVAVADFNGDGRNDVIVKSPDRLTVLLAVTPAPPTLDPIANQTVAENAGAQVVNLTSISPGAGNSGQTLTVSAVSSNPALIPNPTVAYASPNSTGTLTFTPAAGQFGTAVITVTVSETGETATATRSFTVTVSQATTTLVSIAVTPTNPSIAKGTTQQFTAIGTYSNSSTANLTNQVTWASSSPSVATINSTGLATALAQGTTSITAMLSGVTSPAATLNVSAAALVSIAVTPTDPSITKGTTQQFTAIGTYTDATTQDLTSQVTWVSANPTVATISSTGLATALAQGTTSITASLDSVASAAVSLNVTTATLLSIAVTPTNPSIAEGTTQQFTATGTYSDASTQDLTSQVTWTSATPSVAMISNTGLTTALAQGTTSITAMLSGVTSHRHAECDGADAGVDRGDAGRTRRDHGQHATVHRHRYLHRPVDGRPHEPGDLGVVEHLRRDDFQRAGIAGPGLRPVAGDDRDHRDAGRRGQCPRHAHRHRLDPRAQPRRRQG